MPTSCAVRLLRQADLTMKDVQGMKAAKQPAAGEQGVKE
jgi:hypothetical protein